jgi:hypothetical protein
MPDKTQTPEPKAPEPKAKAATASLLTIYVPAAVHPEKGYVHGYLATLPADQVPDGARVIGPPAPVQKDGTIAAIVQATGALVFVPEDQFDAALYARAVAGVHFASL